jgi:hypothetical protein
VSEERIPKRWDPSPYFAATYPDITKFINRLLAKIAEQKDTIEEMQSEHNELLSSLKYNFDQFKLTNASQAAAIAPLRGALERIEALPYRDQDGNNTVQIYARDIARTALNAQAQTPEKSI